MQVPQRPSSQPKDETLAEHDRAGLETVIARVDPVGLGEGPATMRTVQMVRIPMPLPYPSAGTGARQPLVTVRPASTRP
jgi:hypothetical protein